MDKENVREQITSLWRSVQRPGVDRLLQFLEKSDFYTAPCSTKYHLAVEGGLAQHSLNVYWLLKEKVQRFAHGQMHSDVLGCGYQLGHDWISEESIVVCALGHDLCKMNFYKKGGEPCSDSQYQYLKSLIVKWYPHVEGLTQFLDDKGDIRRVSKTHASILIDWLKNEPRSPMPKLPPEWVVEDQLPLGHGEKSLSVLQDYIELTDDEKLAIRWHMTAFEPGIHFDYPSGYAFREAAKRPLTVLLFTADYEASQILEME